VNAIGLGCMGMLACCGAPMVEKEGVTLLHAAIEQGIDDFDTAYFPYSRSWLDIQR
jgi:aryl-alcohol dehydrogenase-like predicted oxidoreductase